MVLIGLMAASQPLAQAQHPVFGNMGAIVVNDDAVAAPYPSVISVSGISGSIGKLTVALAGVTHGRPEDLDVLLVGPVGQKVGFMGQTGEILRELARGLRSKEIADALGIGTGTVNTHVRHIYEKLHVRSRAEAVARLH